MTVLTTSKPAGGSAPLSTTECLCDEHRALAAQLGLLDQVADEIGTVGRDVLRGDVERAYDLVAHRVLPHERAERALHERLAARDRRRIEAEDDQGEARRLVARLAGLRVSLERDDTAHVAGEIRHVLYELHALTRLHFLDELRMCDHPKHSTTGAH